MSLLSYYDFVFQLGIRINKRRVVRRGVALLNTLHVMLRLSYKMKGLTDEWVQAREKINVENRYRCTRGDKADCRIR